MVVVIGVDCAGSEDPVSAFPPELVVEAAAGDDGEDARQDQDPGRYEEHAVRLFQVKDQKDEPNDEATCTKESDQFPIDTMDEGSLPHPFSSMCDIEGDTRSALHLLACLPEPTHTSASALDLVPSGVCVLHWLIFCCPLPGLFLSLLFLTYSRLP